MVLFAGRSEDSLPVVLGAGRWLHDGVIGCGDLTDGRHRLRLASFASAEAGEASGEIVCTHSASAPAPPPLNFTLAPRNADRIVAPESLFPRTTRLPMTVWVSPRGS